MIPTPEFAGAARALGLAMLLFAVSPGPARAAPITPQSDAEVIEVLPGGARAEQRRLQRQLRERPQDAALAVPLARRHIEQARVAGDPRSAGQALAALAAWSDPAAAPVQVLLLQATALQYLHEFDPAAGKLERLLARDPRQPQALLTLATIRRVQGRYAESDRHCAALLALGAGLHGTACRAENDALRGDFAGARASLQPLLADPRLDGGSRNWLLTTLAELEERAGRPAAAEAAYKRALEAGDDAYTVTAYADFLILQGRDADALTVLRERARTDAVLLRLAVAGTRAGAVDAARDAAQMRERIAQANERPQAQRAHAREQAMFALWIDADPQRALALARANVQSQREPIDLLVLAHAAHAAGDAAARREVARLSKEMSLEDKRLAALL